MQILLFKDLVAWCHSFDLFYIEHTNNILYIFASARWSASSGVPSRDSNSGLPFSKPTRYWLCHAAPYVEIVACKLELLQKPIIDFINQEISTERERSITWLLRLCLRHKQKKLRFMEPHIWIAAQSKLLTLWFIGETIEIRAVVVFESYNNNLKVVCNEKQRVDGRWYTLGIGTRPWKLMFIYRLIFFVVYNSDPEL